MVFKLEVLCVNFLTNKNFINDTLFTVVNGSSYTINDKHAYFVVL